jgi:hypothetical protein
LKLDTLGSPEVALLLAASRGDPTRESVRRLMSGRLNWPELTRLAIEAHATPGVWKVISAFPDLPPDATTLQSLAVLNDFRRYHIRSLVVRLSKELRAEGIDVLAMKGAALLVGGVSSPTPRTMSDIDLLVLKGSPEAAWNICRSNGWTLVDPSWTEELYRGHHHLAPLVDPDGVNIGLELHRTLMAGVDRLGLDTLALVKRAHRVVVNDVPVLVPSVEDLLLHTCLHFAWSNKMRRGAWRTYADAHAIVVDPAFSWDRFVTVVTSRRMRQSCYWTLRLGRLVADLCVPDKVLTALDPSSGGRFARLLERHFALQIVDPASDESIAQRARRWLWFSAMQERSTTREADELWSEGAVPLPGEGEVPARAQRGAFRAVVSTCGYVARLLSRA